MITAFAVTAAPATVKLYHGTTELAAQAIMSGGWKSSDPEAVAQRIASLYHVDANELLHHQWFEFSSYRGKTNDPYVYFDTELRTAQHYAEAGSEMVEDALRTVYRMTHPLKDDDGPEYTRNADAWAKSEARKIDHPAVLYIDCPWKTIENSHTYSGAMPGALEQFGVNGTVVLTPDELHGLAVHRA